ncbi:MAG: hypothetical protein IJA62_04535 [Ruminococcus sp.]|nr:hypothetical protein [Ruminococcus sp.]
MIKKFFSSLLVLLMVLQCFMMAMPTAFAETADLSSAGIVTADDSSVVYYSDEAESVQTTRKKTDLASLGAKDSSVEIIKQPVSVSAKKGEAVKVSFSASGDGLTYKWYYKNAGADKFTRTTTFTSNVYSTTMTDARNGRQIYCVVTDKYGNSVKTNTVTLVMKTSLVIKTQPVSVEAELGTTARVSVSAQGEGLTYKWYYKNAGASDFALTTTYISNVYSVKMTEARDGRQVYCVISDKYGNTVKTNVVSLTMGEVLEITKQPQSVVAVKGAVARVSFTAKGEDLVYNWYYKNAGASKFSRTDTFTTNTYSVTMTAGRSGRQIYCVVTDKFGNSVKTNTVTLTMGNALEISQQPSSITVPAGKAASVSFTAKGDGLTYNWYYKNAGASKFVSTSTFKSNKYSVEMNNSRDGRMLYCEVSDKYGNTVRTNTVVINMGTTLKITKQPVSVSVHSGNKARVSFTAVGDGLSYKWYYKNATSTDFSVTDTFKSTSYSVTMNAHRSGREVYCVVTDKYGVSLKTDTVTVSMGHEFGEWEVYRAATAEREGVERRYCKECSYYKDRTTPKLTAVYYITTDLGTGTPSKVGVPKSGEYTLENPKREGYSFAGWKDAKGNDFPRQGVIKEDITVSALWNLDGTDTLRELVDRTNAGVEAIKITSDIVISKSIYISYNTKIYSDGDFSLIRDPNFKGDMFVVGSDNKGQSSVVLRRDAVLTLGGGEGTLTIDGNRDNVNVTVVGSVVFVADSSTLNLYDGVRIANNVKLGNERIYNYPSAISASTGENAGGAGILNLHSTVNMYGGVIENNLVATKHTPIINEDGTEGLKESFGCGGGVYNRGHFNMYGGKITGNEALRGGGFYTDRVAYMFSGEISDNIAHYYGGAISTSSGQHADLFIGSEGEGDTMLIDGNHSYRAGGAIYSNTSSPIIIYGNTVVSNNASDTSGGAVYTAGPLTINDTLFDSNSCVYSGGAIYNHYTKAEFNRRLMELTNCTFTNNKGNLGGAVILSAQDSVADTGLGTFATIKDCNFVGNNAVANEGSGGNGGALYITRKSETIISRCRFEENVAETNAGAVAAHSEAHVDMVDCEFVKNTGNLGGAMYTSSGSKVELKNILFDSNKTVLKENGSGGNGGAVYVSLATPSFENVDFINNSAANHAGAVYMHATTLEFDNTCEFDSNSAAAHGGAFYLTYRNLEDGTKDGSVLKVSDIDFKNNSALAGGAISIRSGCDADLTNVKFTSNRAIGTEKDAQGGGAVYVGFGSLTLDNVTAKDNSSLGYGGVVNSVASTVDVISGSYQDNSAKSGGAFNGISNSTLAVAKADFLGNYSDYENTEYDNTIGGGAINLYSGKLDIVDSTFDANKSGYYGGAVIAAKAEVNINNSIVKNSEGYTGAALFFRYGCTAKLDNISLLDNTSHSNGVLYANGGNLDVVNVIASGNTASNGGVLYASGATTQVTLKDLTWSGNTATNGGIGYISDATLTATNCEFRDNTANLGGVFYAKKGTLNMENVAFNENEAIRNSGGGAGNGGAITMTGGTLAVDSETSFISNTAENHAGALYMSYTTDTLEDGSSVSVPSALTATGTLFDNNSAMAGAAVSIRTGCSAELNDLTLSNNSVEGFIDTKNDGNGEGGGAVYVGYGSLTLNNVTAVNNSASDFGGAVDAVDSTVIINGGTYSENTSNSGGMLHSISGSDITITNAIINNNESVYENKEYNSSIGGGAICTTGGTLTVSDTTLDGNKSAYYGGSVMTSSTQVMFSGNTVVKNSEGGTGAALNFKNKSVVELEDISILDNNSSANGVLYVNNSTLDILNITAAGNSAANGGLIYASNANTNINIVDSAFLRNNATNGGVVNIANGTIVFKNSTLSDNTGKYGAVVYSDNANVTIESSDVKNNMATSYAGVVYATSGTVNFTGGTVSENTATSGGVFFTEAADVLINETTVTKNTSTSNGGVAYAEDGSFEFKNAIVSENSAESNAGVIYVRYTDVVLDSSEFNGNTSGNNGGVLYLSGARGTIKNDCSFVGNSASNHGGAIYDVYTNAVNTEEEQRDKAYGDLTVTGGTFESNTAMSGAVVSIRTGCDAEFNSSTFLNNSVSGFADENDGNGEGGGAVYVGFGSLTLNDVTASGNSASDFGGVVEVMSSDVTINGGKYSENTTVSGAVVRAISDSTVMINDALIEKNTAVDYGVIYQNKGNLTLSNVTASENTAGFGGVLYASNASVNVDITNSTFVKNSAYLGGALNINSGTATVTDSTFTENSALKNSSGSYGNGGAVIVTGGTVIASGENVFESNSAENHGGAVYVTYSNVNNEKVGGTVNMTDGVFKNNTAAVSGGAISSRTNGNVTLTGTKLISNSALSNKLNEGGGAIYTNTNTLTLSGVTMDGNTSGYYAGALMASEAEVTINGNSVISNSQGGTGAALHFAATSNVSISDTEISHNTASVNGAVYVNNSTVDMTNVTASGNKAANGGVIYASNANTKITATDSTFTQNNATNGGAVYIANGAMNFVRGEITENTAKTAGAVYSDNGKVSFDGTSINNNTASSTAGVAYTVDGTLSFANALVEENSAAGNGGAVYVKYTPVTITDSTFANNTSDSNGGALYLAGCNSDITDSDFVENKAKNHGAAIYNVYLNAVNTEDEQRDKAVSNLTVTGGSFASNTAMAGAVVSIRTGCDAVFNGTEFTNNAVSGYDAKADNSGVNDGNGEGGGAVYVGYGSLTLNNVTADGNSASDFGGVVDSVSSTVTINGGTFTNNKSNSGAVIYAMEKSKVTIDGAAINNNESVYENTDYNNKIGGTVYANGGTLEITNTTLDGNKTGYYGGAVYGRNGATVDISDNTVISNSSGATGAAVYFREACNVTVKDSIIKDNTSTGNGVVYQTGGTMTLTNVTASGNKGSNGGVIFSSGTSTKTEIKNCNFIGNTASSGGALTVSESNVSVTGGEFKDNSANLGGAVNIGTGTLTISGVTFTNNSAVKNASGSNGNGGAIAVAAGTLNATGDNLFDGNTAENHGGAIYVSYKTDDNGTKVGGVVNMSEGLFKNNSADISGGAISSRTNGSVALSGTELTANSSYGTVLGEGGGAIYSNDNTLVLSGVVIDGNSSAYYGGGVTALNADVTIDEKSQIKNNVGTTGVALEFRGTGSYTLNDISVTDNISTKGSGVIYITGSGTLNATSLTASGNKNNNGGVIYASGSSKVNVDSSSFVNNTAKNLGGAVDHRSSGALSITNSTFNGNNAVNGGAFHIGGSGAVTIKNSTIDGNTATTLGGGIYHEGSGLLTVSEGTNLKQNTAPSGGGLYLDKGAKATVSSSTFDANSASGADGGAILVADSSDTGTSATSLTVTGSVFKNNTAAKKGGAISTDTASPNLLINVSDTEFTKNSAVGAGGGAIEIQNANQTNATDPASAKIVFTNCEFTENSAKTTGGAIEIRTSSCAKINGITATKNSAKQNGGVVYVTSNFSRLYLTGGVTLSGNTAGSGTFAYLYNNNYSNPPRIYTTDSNSAAWYKEVKGNTSSVTFNLTTMP